MYLHQTPVGHLIEFSTFTGSADVDWKQYKARKRENHQKKPGSF
jgi:hypothetical protein